MLGTLLPEIIAAAGHCVFECEHRLVPLFARSLPGATVVPRATPAHGATLAPGIEMQSSLGGLCRYLRLDANKFAQPRGYIRADPDKVAAIRSRYAALGSGLKVGIAWRSKTPRWGVVKSAPLAAWRPLLGLSGAHFVNLQYGDVADELAALESETGVRVHQDGEIDQMASLDDFAAQIDALDLVISISNTTVHIAGALGKPVWTMLPHVPAWRWQLERQDTLWYPAMRLFRQPTHGAWAPLLGTVAKALAELRDRAPSETE